MTATSNTPLKVPFKEKDEAKSLGARWNPDGKHWYVPVGVDAAPFKKWLTDLDITAAPADMSAPQATVQTNAQTTAQAKPASTLPANVEMDDVNAMLRDAYEVNDDQSM